jgi:glycosyltransferase involved in cell wall biosynthesis
MQCSSFSGVRGGVLEQEIQESKATEVQAAGNRKPRVLCLMHLPPPIHGVSMVGEQIAGSTRLKSRFTLEILPLQFATSIEDIGRLSPRKLLRALRTGLGLTRALVARRPDAVYFTLSPAGNALYRDCAYVAIMKCFRVRRIYHMHAKGVAERLDVAWRRALYEWAFGGAWVIHLSPRLAHDITGVVALDRILYVPNGLPDRAIAMREQPQHDGPPRVLYLSHMLTTKGPLVLLEALAALKARGLPFQATFAGAPADDACFRGFQSSLDRLNLRGDVRYVGPAFGSAKEALFRDHDVFAFPTYREAFGLVLLEAMQWGLPVVSTFEGAIPDIVQDGETGYLVPQRDVGALADRLAILLENTSLRRQMGEAGRARYLEHFTSVHFEQNLVAALDRCLRV